MEYLKKEVTEPFDEIVKKIEETLVKEGFSHMMTKDIDKIFQKRLGVEDYDRYTMILACHPKYAKAALDASKDMGLVFPCSFVVYDEDGKTYVAHISIMKMGTALGLGPEDAMQPVIECTGEGITKVWDQI